MEDVECAEEMVVCREGLLVLSKCLCAAKKRPLATDHVVTSRDPPSH